MYVCERERERERANSCVICHLVNDRQIVKSPESILYKTLQLVFAFCCCFSCVSIFLCFSVHQTRVCFVSNLCETTVR